VEIGKLATVGVGQAQRSLCGALCIERAPLAHFGCTERCTERCTEADCDRALPTSSCQIERGPGTALGL